MGKISPEDWVILELSSFQLVDVLEGSPHISILLRTTSEHLDWHENTFEYRQAKLALIRYQDSRDYTLFCADDAVSTEMAARSAGQRIGFSRNKHLDRGAFVRQERIFWSPPGAGETEEICSVSDVQLIGDFQLENVTAAVAAAKLAGIANEHIQAGIRAFRGLPYRLELRGEKNGIHFFNDSFATIPESTIAALSAFPDNPLMIILGGSSKNSDFSPLAEKLSTMPHLKKAFIFGETAPQILKALEEAGMDIHSEKIEMDCHSLEEIFSAAKKIGASGDVLLLSPACASFDMFENYKKRGDRFNELVEKF